MRIPPDPAVRAVDRCVNTEAMTYDHTQRAPLHILLFVLGAAALLAAAVVVEHPAPIILGVVGLLFSILGLCFAHLRVRDAGLHLDVRFGPLAIFGRRLPYGRMRSAEPSRSALIDGWGIHCIPGRGWIFNLWGFDCVRIETDRGVVRVGSDEADRLAAFLRTRLGK